MRGFQSILVLLLAAGLFAGCDSFVEKVDVPIDSIGDEQLNEPGQVAFLINGVLTRFASTYDQVTVLNDGLSDAFFFDQRVPNATFPTYDQIDDGLIELDNNSVDGLYADLGELRLFADTMLTRLAVIEGIDAEVANEASFIGNFFGGMARYYMGTYFALTQTEPGGVINAGPFIPQAQMLNDAIAKFNTAKGFADAYETRVINTLLARTYLILGNFGQARTAAAAGLQQGDDPYTARYTTEASNLWYVQAGVGRTQWVADYRFLDYVTANPQETSRVKIEVILGNDGTDTTPPTTFYRQAKYLDRSTPLPLTTWQENALMLAELDLRDGNAGPALGHVNTVRASHGIDPLTAVSTDVLLEERDKELFTMGLRVVDQRRYNRWHLGTGTWQYLPITERERNANPNLG